MEWVEKEIVRIHKFFVAWYGGQMAEDEFNENFLNRMDPDFHLISPNGTVLDLETIAGSIRDNYASNPDFRMAIRNVQILRTFDGHVLATYEEWQRNSLAYQPTNNARLGTVLFEGTQTLRWVHLHETWLPKEIMEAGPYDF